MGEPSASFFWKLVAFWQAQFDSVWSPLKRMVEPSHTPPSFVSRGSGTHIPAAWALFWGIDFRTVKGHPLDVVLLFQMSEASCCSVVGFYGPCLLEAPHAWFHVLGIAICVLSHLLGAGGSRGQVRCFYAEQ